MGKFTRIAQNLGLTTKAKSELYEMLNKVLADQHVLAMKTHAFHWNLKSELFPQLHGLFGDQYDALQSAIDETAERCVMLGGVALSSLSEMLSNASLKESKGKFDAMKMVKILCEDNETCVRNLRVFVDKTEELGDMGTNDFLIGLMQGHEKTAWFLRSILKD